MSDDEGYGYQRGAKRSRRNDGDEQNDGSLYLKLLVPHTAVGSIIGKGGEAIIELQRKVGAKCRMSKPDDIYPGTANERICSLTGQKEGCYELVKYIHHKCLEKPDQNPKQDSHGRTIQRHRQVKFVVPNTTAGMIIGKGGCHIREISENCGVKAVVSSKSDNGDDLQSNERIVTVDGESEDGVDRACEMIIQKISEDPKHMANQDISHWNNSGSGQMGGQNPRQMNNGGGGGGGPQMGMNPMMGMMGMNFGPRGPGMMPGMPGMGMGGPQGDQTAAMMAGYNPAAFMAAFGANANGGNIEQLAAAAAQQQMNGQDSRASLQPLLSESFGDGSGLMGSQNGTGLNIGNMQLPRSASASLDKLRGLLDASRYAPVAQDEIIQALLILAKHNLLPGIGQNNEMITNLLVSLSAVGSLHDIAANLGQVNGSNGATNGSLSALTNSATGAMNGLDPAAMAAVNGMFPGMAGMFGGAMNGSNGSHNQGNDGGADIKRETYVEESLVGVVLGPGGKGLREIGKASGGARINVAGREPGSDRRVVSVQGSPHQVERGIRFVEEMVENERRKRARLAHKRPNKM